MDESLDKLRGFLDELGPGRIEKEQDRAALEGHLALAWDDLAGAGEAGMEPWKVDRMEDPDWSPPLLIFTIERHGAMQFGGTRATLQRWTLDLDRATAHHEEHGYRQVRPSAPRIDVQRIADELAGHIIERIDDERLEWSFGRRRVRILIGKALPPGLKQTTTSRRTRLRTGQRPDFARNDAGRAARRPQPRGKPLQRRSARD